MKAAVCYEFGNPLVIADVRIVPPRRDEAKVRIVATAVCHSDAHLVRGDWGGRLPVVAGHEAAGVVDEIGQDVAHVKPGDPLVVSLLRTCGQCFFCRNGTPHLCDANFGSLEQTCVYNKHGHPLHRGMRTAAFAEHVVVHESQLVPLPFGMPLDQAALLSCGVITGFGAVVNAARVAPRESVAVIGCGGVGLNVVQAAALNGARPVIAVDIRNTKLDAARRFGATSSINPLCENVVEAPRQATAGRGADFAFVTVGELTPVIQALKLVRRGE